MINILKIAVIVVSCFSLLTIGGCSIGAAKTGVSSSTSSKINTNSISDSSISSSDLSSSQSNSENSSSKITSSADDTAHISQSDVNALENSQYSGPFLKTDGNRIYYNETKTSTINGNPIMAGTNKQGNFLFDSKTVFIMVKTYKQGTEVEPAVSCSSSDMKRGCFVYGQCEKQGDNMVASKVLIMTFD